MIVKRSREIMAEPLRLDEDDRKGNNAINRGENYCAVSSGFPRLCIRRCLLIVS